jgi:hypothetical protein
MSANWEFRADGTLHVMAVSRLSGTEHDVYRWEGEAPFRIRLGLPPCEDAANGTWVTVLYEFAVLEHDAGHEVVLREVGKQGFWLSEAPLRPEGD